MDTKTFLSTILPERGFKFVARIHPRVGKKDATIHYPMVDFDDMVDKLLELDRSYSNDNIYYATASYTEVKHATTALADGREFEYVVGRTKENAQEVKSIWLDIDVGKKDCYATRKEALAGLKTYIKAVGLPVPLIVSSGYGLHCYWVFTEAVSAAAWEDIAKYQRVAWRHVGLKADPACDKDCARILRAPGCRNKKPGLEPRVVKVVKEEFTALPAAEYKRRFRKYAEENNLTFQIVESAPAWVVAAQGSGNLGAARVEYPDSFAEIAVEHCQQLRLFRETGGDSEPLWYASLGAMKFFKDGEALAHTWSAKHEAYDEDQTQLKMDQWGVGPTTCAKFRDLNPEGCAECPHARCTTPVQLGYREATAADAPSVEDAAQMPVAEVVESEAPDDLPEDASAICGWPEGFTHNATTGVISSRVRDAQGVFQQVPMASPLFYPVEQIRTEDGTYAFRMHMWVRGRTREFQVPTKYLQDKKGLAMALAQHQVTVMNQDTTKNYMNGFMTNLVARREAINTYRQMGWQNDFKGFLLGDVLITENEAQRVVVSEKVKDLMVGRYSAHGEKQPWVDAVDTLFNREHGEPHQFAICAAFAAPLHALLGFAEWKGIPFALTTDESGFGKTTVNKIACSIWMNPENALVADSTAKAVLGLASVFNNVPFVLDEVTQYLAKPEDMASVLYALSNGQPRQGMTQGGGLRDALPTWRGVYPLTGNRKIMTQVAENKLNPEATQMRVFEIDLDMYPRVATMEKGSAAYKAHNAEHALLARTIVEDCYGVIGPEYVRFVMKNLDTVREKLRATSIGMGKYMEGGDETKERFFYHLITTVMVGGYYAKRLGYIKFDLNKLMKWCINHVRKLRDALKEARCTPEDHFAAFMGDVVGKLIVTRNFEGLDARSGVTEAHMGQALRNPISGRFVAGGGTTNERPQLYVTIRALQQWCAENGVQYSALRRDMLKAGLIRLGRHGVNRETGAQRVHITKGVREIPSMGNPWCLELDVERASALIPALDTKVVPIVQEPKEPVVVDLSDEELAL